ncbi:MAG: hypothetical protein WKG32_04485 [Gemmatimonadaceae bacterium]
MSPRARVRCAWALIGLGSLRMLAHVIGADALGGIAAATAAAPLPLVFTHFRGFEPFASRFEVEFQLDGGRVYRAPLTPKVYAKLGGPHSRRNVYGLAIAFGPGLTADKERALWQSVLRYGFCDDGPLIRAFEIPGRVERAVVLVSTKTAGRHERWQLEVVCGA